MRKTRAGMPATLPSAKLMWGRALGASLMSLVSSPSRRRAFGPAMETVANCSVTLVRCTCSSGHSHCSQSSRWPRIEAALPVVVVIR